MPSKPQEEWSHTSTSSLSKSWQYSIYRPPLDNPHRGFAAKAPAKVLETVQTWGNDYHAVIEEDQMVSIVGGGL